MYNITEYYDGNAMAIYGKRVEYIICTTVATFDRILQLRVGIQESKSWY